jgi:hypothetical protein
MPGRMCRKPYEDRGHASNRAKARLAAGRQGTHGPDPGTTQDQLLAGLAALVLGSTVALLLGRPGPADELTAMLRTVDTAGLTADARLTRGL